MAQGTVMPQWILHQTARALLFVCALSTVARAADEGAWLERAAEDAVKKGGYPRAVALLRGLTALHPKDPSPQYRLAEVYATAGQYVQATAEYRRFAARPEADPVRKERALAEAARLEDAPPPFAETLFRQAAATPEAKRLYAEGMKDAKANRYKLAEAELSAAALLDPDLPGPYRVLGAIYGKTGDAAEERRFLSDYLRVRPDGKIAETVRQRLAKDHVLGSMSIEASFPCRVYVDGRPTEKTTPLKHYSLPPGKYVVSLENEAYHIVRNLRLEITAEQDVERFFAFGILGTKLDPWARVRVDGKDIGLWDEAGIPEGTHHVSYRSHDGSREKSVELTIKGGARAKLSW
jgi:Flp pilus assembly protein TadD